MRSIALAVVVFLAGNLSLTAATWQTDHDAAMQAAKAQKRAVLVNFTGSDWCGWCVRLKKEVFDTAEFQEFADSRLILLELDFPKIKPQSAAVRKANENLARHYKVEGFPTVFILSPEGRVLRQLGYMAGGPKVFLGEISKLAPARPAEGWIVGKADPQPAATPTPAPEPEPAVPVKPTGPAAKVVYDKLVLKGITGSANRPLALINNKTFAPGDSYKVQVGAESIKVSCISVANDHVMVQVDGDAEPRKLVMGSK